MEPCVEIFVPSRVYVRAGWATLAGSLLCVLGAFREPVALIPGLAFAAIAAALFWLASRPPIRIGETQFNIGERAIAWVDDNFDESCYEWAERRTWPTLLVPTEPQLGLEEGHVEALAAWATSLHSSR